MRHSRVGYFVLSLMLTSCGSDGPGTTEPDPPRPTVLNVIPDDITLSFLGATSTLVPHIRDQNGQPIAATVTWSSDNMAVATVNGSGLLTAVQNGTATVTATAGSLSDVVAVTVQQVATQLEVASGGDQSATAGQALGEAVAVRAKDAGGAPTAGANLSFVVSAGGGTVGDPTVTTDADGLASTTWTLGTVAGEQTMDVSFVGGSTAPLQVSATGLAGAAAVLAKSSGDSQDGAIGQAVPEPVVAQLQDEFGNGVAGGVVTFAVTGGGGSVSPATVTTDAAGLASTTWTMGPTVGAATLSATATGFPSVVFTATAVIPQADLTPATIVVSPVSPTSLQTFTVTVPVTNNGTAAPGGSFSVQLLADGVEAATASVAPMAPGATSIVVLTAGPLAAGTRLLSVVVDPNGTVTESDETNNTTQQSVTILAQTLLAVGTPITGMSDAMTFEREVISTGYDSEPAPRLGASDVGVGESNGERILASVEPWHGNEVVVYTQSDGAWQRRVIFDAIQSGHEIAVLDLNGDGLADIVANDNSRVSERNPNGTPGVHVFFSPEDPATGEWIYRRIESEAGMNGCVGGDMNEDGRPDIICTGSGGVIRWYENLGNEEPASETAGM